MNIKLTDKKGLTGKADCLVVGVFEGEKDKLGAAGLLSAAEKVKYKGVLGRRKMKGAKSSSLLLPAAGSRANELVWFFGLGKKSACRSDEIRKFAAAVYRKAKAEKWENVRIDFDSITPAIKDDSLKQPAQIANRKSQIASETVQCLSEGLLLSDYAFDAYKSKKSESKGSFKAIEIAGAGKVDSAQRSALKTARILSDAVRMTRDLGNEPANTLYPESYAGRIAVMARKAGIKCTVYKGKDLTRMKMGGILAVGMGSERKPCLVEMVYKPKRAKNAKPIVLVGKGVTFDSGGISIKPSKAMDEMKYDMCGSSAVVGAMKAIAALGLPLYVIGLTPLAENMPSGAATRPGDVIRCHNGKTVDVLNTDAEGRLILADALAYAKKFKPLCVVDAATLTGACAYTLSYVASGVMGNNKDVLKRLMDSAGRTGERLWEFPLWEEYDEFIKGTYGDIQNISKNSAGIQTAGMFLKHFADHSPWAHVDIAGTAWTMSARGYNPVGATGVGVRLFTDFVKSYL